MSVGDLAMTTRAACHYATRGSLLLGGGDYLLDPFVYHCVSK